MIKIANKKRTENHQGVLFATLTAGAVVPSAGALVNLVRCEMTQQDFIHSLRGQAELVVQKKSTFTGKEIVDMSVPFPCFDQ